MSRRLLTPHRLGRRVQSASSAPRIFGRLVRVSCLAQQSRRRERRVSRYLGGVESRVALEAGSVSAGSGLPELKAVPQLTGWQVERSAHRAVDDTRLEAGVSVTKRDGGRHANVIVVCCVSRLWCLRRSLCCASPWLLVPLTCRPLSPYLATL